jgi:NhaP-type Na+/H+ or K+/H+ antiporter
VGSGILHLAARLPGQLRLITVLAVGLVLATAAAVAAVARALVPGLSWAPALALGAIVSPPDAVAATSIARRLGIPYRIITILEGESLVNDASALIVYRSAVAAAVTWTFVLTQAVQQFVLVSVGGVIIGLLVGVVTRRALRLSGENLAQIAITLLAPMSPGSSRSGYTPRRSWRVSREASISGGGSAWPCPPSRACRRGRCGTFSCSS